MTETVTAALIIIGNEILSGRIQDTNVRHLALALNEAGVRLQEVRFVADDEAAIVKAVNELRIECTYVFTTGGIGPTHDDITSECVARAFGVPLLRDPRAVALLSRIIKPENLNEARLRMANIPQGADLIDNPVSHAPGFRLGNVHVMAGIPRIMQAMLNTLLPGLKGGAPMRSLSVTLFTGEGTTAAALGEIQRAFSEVEIGSYPFVRDGGYGAVVVVRGTDPAILEQVVAAVTEMAHGLGVQTEPGG